MLDKYLARRQNLSIRRLLLREIDLEATKQKWDLLPFLTLKTNRRILAFKTGRFLKRLESAQI